MSATSTAPAIYDALIALYSADGFPVPAFDVWPGPESHDEMLVLGEAEWDEYAIATIKAGRKYRQEEYTIGFDVYVFGEEGSEPSTAAPCRDRAFEVLGLMEDALALDVTAGTSFDVVQHVQLRPLKALPVVFVNGWAFKVAGEFAVAARLQ